MEQLFFIFFQLFLTCFIVLLYFIGFNLEYQILWSKNFDFLLGRSVSICNESYPNGPCTKKDGEAGKQANEGTSSSENEVNESGEDDRERVKIVASKLVDDIIRVASTAAHEKLIESSESPSCSSTSTSHLETSLSPEIPLNQTSANPTENECKSEKLKRLPTIQIDTVPSIPSSPTEWQAPSSKDIISEEEEADILDDKHIELSFGSSSKNSGATDEIQEFATSYIKDIITKAMDLSEERLKDRDTETAKEIASKVVGDIITQANDKAFEKLRDGLDFPENVPCIQIDTVPDRPPSPSSEEDEQKSIVPPVESPLKGKKFIFHDDDDEDDVKVQSKVQSPEDVPCIQIDTVPSNPPSPTYEKDEQNCAANAVKAPLRRKKFIFRDEDDDGIKPQPKVQKLIKHSEAPVEIKEFASSYVKDIISKAITMAEEKLVSSVPFNFEDVDMMKVSGPWYIRAREAFLRLLRSACFCTPRRNDS